MGPPQQHTKCSATSRTRRTLVRTWPCSAPRHELRGGVGVRRQTGDGNGSVADGGDRDGGGLLVLEGGGATGLAKREGRGLHPIQFCNPILKIYLAPPLFQLISQAAG